MTEKTKLCILRRRMDGSVFSSEPLSERHYELLKLLIAKPVATAVHILKKTPHEFTYKEEDDGN